MTVLSKNWRMTPAHGGFVGPNWKTENPRIVAAASRIKGITFVASRHFSSAMHSQMTAANLTDEEYAMAEQGFIDNHDRFWSREEAAEIVFETQQQLKKKKKGLLSFFFKTQNLKTLFSEDLY